MKKLHPISRFRRIYWWYNTRKEGNLTRSPPERQIARRYKRAGAVLFDLAFHKETGRKPPARLSDRNIITHCFWTSINELNRLTKKPRYYDCNAFLFKKYMLQISNKIISGEDIHKRIAADFMFEATYLIHEHNTCLNPTKIDYGVSKMHQDRTITLYANSKSLSWTGVSKEMNLSIATLRLAIENRIRSAFGIYGLRNTTTHATQLVTVSNLIKQMQKHSSSIVVSPPIEIIDRIYNWSNHYIHSLYGTYPWLVLYAHDAIAPLFEARHMGEYKAYEYSIQAPRHVIEAIRSVGNYGTDRASWMIDGPGIEYCSIGVLD